jgi:hypothetical protein
MPAHRSIQRLFDVISTGTYAADVAVDKSKEHAEAIIERFLMQAMSSDVIYKIVPATSVNVHSETAEIGSQSPASLRRSGLVSARGTGPPRQASP